MSFIAALSGIWSKIILVFSSIWGWIVIALTAILNHYLPIKFQFILLMVVIFVDMISGILASIKSNKSITSDRLRGTLLKVLIYMVLLMLTFSAEQQFDFNFTTLILFAIAYIVELYSVAANLLIIKPDMPFLRLITGTLIGEISQKMGLEKDEVKEILNEKQNGNE